ncbi:MAG: CHAD domain-containing protein [Rhodocyclales bacterium]|nr:CHAD domain-containing protein [Rhodocyclales bacterium]
MAEEIELKLALRMQDQPRLLRQALLKTARQRQSALLDNIYYDTPDLALRRRGIALRLRRQGPLWLQTIKLAGTATAGLSSRPEWEIPYAGHFDFSAIEVKAVRDWLQRPRLLARLTPIFETRFRRTTWHFALPDGDVIFTLDRGWIIAGGQRENISELELELADAATGQVAALFALAHPLAARLPLTPATCSKAERGYRLHTGMAPQPAKATPIELDDTLSPLAAFRHIALACLDHLQQNHAGALSSDDPEYIHQMRVALRRLLAALRLFAPQLPEALPLRLKESFRPLVQQLGLARDLDVLQTEIVAPVLAALPDEPRLAQLSNAITLQRYRARSDVNAQLQAPAYGQTLLAALHTLLCQLPVADNPPAASTPPASPPLTLPAFAAAQLRRLHKTLLRRAQAAHAGDPVSLHALRIAVKRLRYALEFLAPLTRGTSSRRTLRRLAGTQDTLGQLNDLAQAGSLLMRCAGDDPQLREAVTLIGGWHGPRHARLLATVPEIVASLPKLRLPRLSM